MNPLRYSADLSFGSQIFPESSAQASGSREMQPRPVPTSDHLVQIEILQGTNCDVSNPDAEIPQTQPSSTSHLSLSPASDLSFDHPRFNRGPERSKLAVQVLNTSSTLDQQLPPAEIVRRVLAENKPAWRQFQTWSPAERIALLATTPLVRSNREGFPSELVNLILRDLLACSQCDGEDAHADSANDSIWLFLDEYPPTLSCAWMSLPPGIQRRLEQPIQGAPARWLHWALRQCEPSWAKPFRSLTLDQAEWLLLRLPVPNPHLMGLLRAFLSHDGSLLDQRRSATGLLDPRLISLWGIEFEMNEEERCALVLGEHYSLPENWVPLVRRWSVDCWARLEERVGLSAICTFLNKAKDKKVFKSLPPAQNKCIELTREGFKPGNRDSTSPILESRGSSATPESGTPIERQGEGSASSAGREAQRASVQRSNTTFSPSSSRSLTATPPASETTSTLIFLLDGIETTLKTLLPQERQLFEEWLSDTSRGIVRKVRPNSIIHKTLISKNCRRQGTWEHVHLSGKGGSLLQVGYRRTSNQFEKNGDCVLVDWILRDHNYNALKRSGILDHAIRSLESQNGYTQWESNPDTRTEAPSPQKKPTDDPLDPIQSLPSARRSSPETLALSGNTSHQSRASFIGSSIDETDESEFTFERDLVEPPLSAPDSSYASSPVELDPSIDFSPAGSPIESSIPEMDSFSWPTLPYRQANTPTATSASHFSSLSVNAPIFILQRFNRPVNLEELVNSQRIKNTALPLVTSSPPPALAPPRWLQAHCPDSANGSRILHLLSTRGWNVEVDYASAVSDNAFQAVVFLWKISLWDRLAQTEWDPPLFGEKTCHQIYDSIVAAFEKAKDWIDLQDPALDPYVPRLASDSRNPQELAFAMLRLHEQLISDLEVLVDSPPPISSPVEAARAILNEYERASKQTPLLMQDCEKACPWSTPAEILFCLHSTLYYSPVPCGFWDRRPSLSLFTLQSLINLWEEGYDTPRIATIWAEMKKRTRRDKGIPMEKRAELYWITALPLNLTEWPASPFLRILKAEIICENLFNLFLKNITNKAADKGKTIDLIKNDINREKNYIDKWLVLKESLKESFRSEWIESTIQKVAANLPAESLLASPVPRQYKHVFEGGLKLVRTGRWKPFTQKQNSFRALLVQEGMQDLLEYCETIGLNSLKSPQKICFVLQWNATLSSDFFALTPDLIRLCKSAWLKGQRWGEEYLNRGSASSLVHLRAPDLPDHLRGAESLFLSEKIGRAAEVGAVWEYNFYSNLSPEHHFSAQQNKDTDLLSNSDHVFYKFSGGFKTTNINLCSALFSKYYDFIFSQAHGMNRSDCDNKESFEEALFFLEKGHDFSKIYPFCSRAACLPHQGPNAIYRSTVFGSYLLTELGVPSHLWASRSIGQNMQVEAVCQRWIEWASENNPDMQAKIEKYRSPKFYRNVSPLASTIWAACDRPPIPRELWDATLRGGTEQETLQLLNELITRGEGETSFEWRIGPEIPPHFSSFLLEWGYKIPSKEERSVDELTWICEKARSLYDSMLAEEMGPWLDQIIEKTQPWNLYDLLASVWKHVVSSVPLPADFSGSPGDRWEFLKRHWKQCATTSDAPQLEEKVPSVVSEASRSQTQSTQESGGASVEKRPLMLEGEPSLANPSTTTPTIHAQILSSIPTLALQAILEGSFDAMDSLAMEKAERALASLNRRLSAPSAEREISLAEAIVEAEQLAHTRLDEVRPLVSFLPVHLNKNLIEQPTEWQQTAIAVFDRFWNQSMELLQKWRTELSEPLPQDWQALRRSFESLKIHAYEQMTLANDPELAFFRRGESPVLISFLTMTRYLESILNHLGIEYPHRPPTALNALAIIRSRWSELQRHLPQTPSAPLDAPRGSIPEPHDRQPLIPRLRLLVQTTVNQLSACGVPKKQQPLDLEKKLVWLKSLQNGHYTILRVPADGDCGFHALLAAWHLQNQPAFRAMDSQLFERLLQANHKPELIQSLRHITALQLEVLAIQLEMSAVDESPEGHMLAIDVAAHLISCRANQLKEAGGLPHFDGREERPYVHPRRPNVGILSARLNALHGVEQPVQDVAAKETAFHILHELAEWCDYPIAANKIYSNERPSADLLQLLGIPSEVWWDISSDQSAPDPGSRFNRCSSWFLRQHASYLRNGVSAIAMQEDPRLAWPTWSELLMVAKRLQIEISDAPLPKQDGPIPLEMGRLWRLQHSVESGHFDLAFWRTPTAP